MKFRAARQNMVDSQVRPSGVTDRRIADAMAAVTRERFVPDELQNFAYMGESVLLKAGAPPRWLIEPMAFARILQLAEIRPEDKILLVGAGTGYGAAVLARIGAHVVALEQDADLLRLARANLDGLLNVTLAEGELPFGNAAGAPFDVIIAEGSLQVVPTALINQLAEDGRIVVALRDGHTGHLEVGTFADGAMSWRQGADCVLPELPGFKVKAPEFVF